MEEPSKLTDEQKKAIADAGYQIVGEKDGKIIVKEIKPMSEIMSSDDMATALREIVAEQEQPVYNGRQRGRNSYGGPFGRKIKQAQPWRVKEEARRLARIKK